MIFFKKKEKREGFRTLRDVAGWERGSGIVRTGFPRTAIVVGRCTAS